MTHRSSSIPKLERTLVSIPLRGVVKNQALPLTKAANLTLRFHPLAGSS
ncbi:MAG: hypothetical protein HC903_24185 [Methylacidiphilales bacterium]|nr:hypothetical protein [Candidatus Methylacidiphilales bacterium]